ncbi:septal ring lytic transglycosylase RlpA family protein [Xanthomonas hortorum]|uniref:Endolytic peptidoglycan transglycosylase RlpA n=1 Tax=Xanthomonas hortorum pv. pelargonii TaxID=453602 RepID=A0A6V7C0X8_9XANT|nr:septal ring lytic transglycosylase RlpA family protein [Xanthomonas hortorum]MCE4355462.1 septal ring lytic transglycosylase RlpA family protein [Xanthomonas hortorum pv. pelargonii]MCM5523441.1 septal ring lytic transglycosylase RlpA family protein [Xanthomonas hortorum pv. pelargonii]MCM5535530.1 septal ring lytic transglycosylase RlpA family protein [Xanthomonas hortorum pv. pelargonii]MCM5539200.1 septal ring lytic transglycosylase RlpA family protein [Xanthomonas hortorum pv. pelargonii
MNSMTGPKWLIPMALMLGLAACSSAPKKSSGSAGSGAIKGVKVEGKGPAYVATGCPSSSPYAAAKEDPSTRGDYTAGGLYKPGVKDTTPDHVPNVACIPEPLVSNEPRSAVGNRSPYEVLGKRYVVMDNPGDYVERGTASYYGSKFHGRLTSNKEVYDMYAFTAAHKTLPLPSFALVTNTDTGDSVVVRVNDRGPFHDGRVIDLSYAAAVKLGITGKGTGNVEVRGLTEADNGNLLAKRRNGVVPVATGVAAARPASGGSQIDGLVQRLPNGTVAPRAVAASSAAVPVATSIAAAPVTAAGERWRYHVADSRQPGNPDNFDAWMKSQGVRVATGKPASVAPRPASATTSTPAPAAPVAVAVVKPAGSAPLRATKPEPVPAKAPSVAETALGDILLQVASFASRENANRALSQLASAGIAGASVSDIVSGGRTLWRLRVNARDHANASEIAQRIAGLGFGRPQIVAN